MMIKSGMDTAGLKGGREDRRVISPGQVRKLWQQFRLLQNKHEPTESKDLIIYQVVNIHVKQKCKKILCMHKRVRNV